MGNASERKAPQGHGTMETIPPRPLSPELSARFYNMSFICACLVVAKHALCTAAPGTPFWWFYHVFSQGVCAIAVPFFFFASGFFLAKHTSSPGWWRIENRKRLRSLLLPYLVWGILFAAVDLASQMAANLSGGRSPLAGLPSAGHILLKTLGLIPTDTPWLGPMWYVRSLLLLCLGSCLFVPILRRSRRHAFAWLLACTLACAVYPRFVGPGPQFFLRYFLSLNGLFYFSCGLALYLWPLSVRPPRWLSFSFLLIALAVFSLNARALATGCAAPVIPAYLVFPPAIIGLFSLLPRRPFPPCLVHSSFALYCLHMFAMLVLYTAARWTSCYDVIANRFWGYLLIVPTTILLCICFTAATRRFFPRLAGFLFGGR